MDGSHSPNEWTTTEHWQKREGNVFSGPLPSYRPFYLIFFLLFCFFTGMYAWTSELDPVDRAPPPPPSPPPPGSAPSFEGRRKPEEEEGGGGGGSSLSFAHICRSTYRKPFRLSSSESQRAPVGIGNFVLPTLINSVFCYDRINSRIRIITDWIPKKKCITCQLN